MKDKITMPSSGAGITRYFEESKSKFQIRPDWVLLVAVLIMFFVWFLHLVVKL